MKYVFFGTPEFAGIILNGLIGAGISPQAVVCNPDRPVGRKKIITAPITKQVAKQHNIPVYQPDKKKDLVELSPTLAAIADFAVVAAYAKIIPAEVIDQFKLGIVGVHPSLLPKFRGPSPIQSAILSDEEKTGTSLFMLTPGVDDGDILAQAQTEIVDKTYTELLRELAQLSVELLIEKLPQLSDGEAKLSPQDEGEATLTSFFEPDAGLVTEDDFEQALAGDDIQSTRIWKMIRALNPEPGVYTHLNGKRTKLLAARKENSRLILETIQKEGKKPESL